jgi:Putative redox-active protein (C_GCAxxG_C_C)
MSEAKENNTDKTISRRMFFASAGTLVAAAAVTTAGCSTLRTREEKRAKAVTWPLPYKTLDVEEVRKRGYVGYYEGECGYGTFSALIGSLADKVGYPYTVIPPQMTEWAKGGGEGYTATCGAIVGASCAVNMVAPQKIADKIVAEIFEWYEKTPFPSDIANQMAHRRQFPVEKYKSTLIFPQVITKSPLCHISVTQWCKEAGYASGSKERSERCARLTSDVAVFTASRLNDYFATHAFKKEYAMAAATQKCRSCHAKGKAFETGGWTRGKMECDGCHHMRPDHMTNNG